MAHNTDLRSTQPCVFHVLEDPWTVCPLCSSWYTCDCQAFWILGETKLVDIFPRFFTRRKSVNSPEPFSAANGMNDAVNLMLALEFYLGWVVNVSWILPQSPRSFYFIIIILFYEWAQTPIVNKSSDYWNFYIYIYFIIYTYISYIHTYVYISLYIYTHI